MDGCIFQMGASESGHSLIRTIIFVKLSWTNHKDDQIKASWRRVWNGKFKDIVSLFSVNHEASRKLHLNHFEVHFLNQPRGFSTTKFQNFSWTSLCHSCPRLLGGKGGEIDHRSLTLASNFGWINISPYIWFTYCYFFSQKIL